MELMIRDNSMCWFNFCKNPDKINTRSLKIEAHKSNIPKTTCDIKYYPSAHAKRLVRQKRIIFCYKSNLLSKQEKFFPSKMLFTESRIPFILFFIFIIPIQRKSLCALWRINSVHIVKQQWRKICSTNK